VNGGSVKITAKNAVIAPNGAIDADGRGFAGGVAGAPETQEGYGPGRPPFPPGTAIAGASHGGIGGFKTGASPSFFPADPYGDERKPLLPGSGTGATTGPGQPGGGVIWLEVADTFSFYGKLKASGGEQPCHSNVAGGAGGSIYVHTKIFEGEGGAMTANGSLGGSSTLIGGGGGRIALWRMRDRYTWEPGGWQERATLQAQPHPDGAGFGFTLDPPAQPGSVLVIDIAEPGTTLIIR
ncbi:MAG: hypothetical protein FWF84_02910, partial [Kiritimatiellaeota bacterium]|nr:hypothetical protein [Kiritimatiellota bacterium]